MKIFCLKLSAIFFFFVYFAATAAGAEKNKHDWFWLFYESEVRGSYSSLVVRPFYMINKDIDQVFDASLMPIVFWRYRTEKQETWKSFFSFIISSSYIHNNKVKEYDLGIFPLLYYGTSSEKKEKYFLLWPFGGTLKGKLGMEKISAYIFPGFLLFVFFPPASFFSFQTLGFVILSLVPAFASYEQKDYKGYSIFWPLIHWGKSPIRKEIRVMPFYSHFSKKGWYDRYSVLLLFNYRRTYFKNDEVRTFFFFPVFGRKWSRSKRVSAYTILWPLFSWGYDKKIGDRNYNLPWPIVQVQDCREPRIVKRIFFPFYGYYRKMSSKTRFVTPLFFWLGRKKNDFKSDYYINLLIFWYFKREYSGKPDDYYGNSWRYFKMWPVFNFEYNDKGDFSFNFLSLLPFRDPDGYEKLYQPFWSIVEYRKFKNGDKRLGLLFRLYYQSWGKDFIKVSIPFFIICEKNENRLTELNFFLYMFGYSHKKKGRYLRFFWIPIKIGESAIKEEGDTAYTDEGQPPHLSSFVRNGYWPDKVQFSYQLF